MNADKHELKNLRSPALIGGHFDSERDPASQLEQPGEVGLAGDGTEGPAAEGRAGAAEQRRVERIQRLRAELQIDPLQQGGTLAQVA